MKKAVIGIGSYTGNRLNNITNAIQALKNLADTTVIATSRFYENAPKAGGIENESIHACVLLLTELSPKVLLGACMGIASVLQIEPYERYDFKGTNLDLLLYEEEILKESELKLPFPGILNKAFLLLPLNDLFPEKTAMGLDFSSCFLRIDDSETHVLEAK